MGGRKSKPSGNKMGDFKLDPIRFEVEMPWGAIVIEKMAQNYWKVCPQLCPLYGWNSILGWSEKPESFHWTEIPALLVSIKDKPYP